MPAYCKLIPIWSKRDKFYQRPRLSSRVQARPRIRTVSRSPRPILGVCTRGPHCAASRRHQAERTLPARLAARPDGPIRRNRETAADFLDATKSLCACCGWQGDAQDIFDQSLGSGLNVATELLVSDGLSDEQAQVAFDVMRTSTLAGRISFMRVRNDGVVFTYGVTVGQDGDDIWMAYAAPSQADGLTLETVLKGAFRHQLERGWSSLGLT